MSWRIARSLWPACGTVLPTQRPLQNPASRQQHKPSLCFGQLDDMQRDALGCCGIGGRLSRVALVDIGELETLAGRILDLGREAFDRCPIADIGRGDMQGKRWPSVSTAMCTLEPRLRLAPS